MFARAADDIGAPVIAQRLRDALTQIQEEELDEAQIRKILNPLRIAVLNTAKRFGKARFAQIAARHVGQATEIPQYLADAVEWLKAP
jgi:putative ATP-dependent endonuclease of OLD family